VRQSSLLIFCSAVIALLLLAGGESDLSAKTVKNQAKTDRGGYTYGASYESRGGRGDRDITPEGNSGKSSCNNDDSRAASVSNGSVEVKYPDNKKRGNNCRITVYTVKKGDTLYGISRKTGAGVDSIISMNRINGNRINAGMKLKIETCKSSSLSGKTCTNNKSFKSEKAPKSGKSSGLSGRFSWPLKKVNNYRRDGSEDIKSIGIFITGTPEGDVVASLEGVVKKVGYMRGYGRYVAISHEGRYVTVYSNLSNIYVKEGTSVSKGRVIGTLSSDRTLHFQIGHAGKPENPLKHLPGRG